MGLYVSWANDSDWSMARLSDLRLLALVLALVIAKASEFFCFFRFFGICLRSKPGRARTNRSFNPSHNADVDVSLGRHPAAAVTHLRAKYVIFVSVALGFQTKRAEHAGTVRAAPLAPSLLVVASRTC